MTKLSVMYPSHAGVRAWTERREMYGAPDVWPYGMNRIGNYIECVNAVDLDELGRFERAMVSVRGRRSASTANTAAVSWDERGALRMLRASDADRMYAGVIWATDDLARGENRPRCIELRRLLRQLDGVWCLSRAQVRPLVDWLGIDRSRVHFLPFGVDSEFFHVGGDPDEAPLIVSFGNDRDRDPETLFGALEIVLSERPDVNAVVQCDTDLPAPKGVKVISRVTHTEVRTMYRRCSLAMVATRPNLHASGMTVALEAMSSGRPVIANRTPGMDDYIEDGATGYLLPCGDGLGMAEAALELLNSPKRAANFGLAARQRVCESFTTELMAERIAKIIEV